MIGTVSRLAKNTIKHTTNSQTRESRVSIVSNKKQQEGIATTHLRAKDRHISAGI